jgi:subtilisin
MRSMITGLMAIAVVLACAAPAGAGTIAGRYVVTFKDSVGDPAAVADEHGRKYGVKRSHVYVRALKGYAAAISDSRLAAVRADARVASVTPDVELQLPPGAAEPAAAAAAVAPTCPLDTRSGFPEQCIPPGIDRIDADASSTVAGDGAGAVGINVAVIDDGIDRDHPDLDVAGGTNCSGGSEADWDATVGPGGGEKSMYGEHGTLVGGIIGARDNDFGVVGVAPGARLWGVRVFNRAGVGSTAQLICGIEWAIATRFDGDPGNDVAVANMSLGGPGSDDASCGIGVKGPDGVLHRAICALAAAGIVPVAAAGNETDDVARHVPAAFDEVLVASGMSDYDGRPGGETPSFCAGEVRDDDIPAFFSNFATLRADEGHIVAAPGMCNVSTVPLGLFLPEFATAYGINSGTSFATPGVSGVVAMCIASGACAGLTPRQIVAKIVADARAYNLRNRDYGFLGDPLRPLAGTYYGYLVRAGLY